MGKDEHFTNNRQGRAAIRASMRKKLEEALVVAAREAKKKTAHRAGVEILVTLDPHTPKETPMKKLTFSREEGLRAIDDILGVIAAASGGEVQTYKLDVFPIIEPLN